MTPAEIVVAEVGGFTLAGAVIGVAREALKRNWVKVSFSFGITSPDARFLKPRAAVQPEPEQTAAAADLRQVG